MSKPTFTESALRTITMEAKAVEQLRDKIGRSFSQACELMLNCQGRVIVTGMGKSHHIASKIAATLSSTGTPSFFVHPAEASHGDLGMITAKDVVLALSNSGKTVELVTLLPLLKRLKISLISMTGDEKSILAKSADVSLNTAVEVEACPLDLAPTSSTTVALVMGDALAIALLEARGFSAEDYAFSHPGGTLGKRLLLKVADVMHTESSIPQVASGTTLNRALLEVSSKGLGMTIISSIEGQLLGIFTDGDLRRALLKKGEQAFLMTVDKLMNSDPKLVDIDFKAVDAIAIMERYRITALFVVSGESKVLKGLVRLHDLISAKII